MTSTLLRQFLYFLLLCIFISCRENAKQISTDKPQYSNTQKYLIQLLDNYKEDYFTASSKQEKEKIQTKYQDKMEHFLVDSLERYIDSMTVVVDTVIKEGLLVTTQLHTGDIEFKYGMNFQDSMSPSFDSLYKFMINLSPRQLITVNFIHLGGGELNYPDDKSKKTMRIFAYPSPLKL